jgi:hypothetical protein
MYSEKPGNVNKQLSSGAWEQGKKDTWDSSSKSRQPSAGQTDR